jgi:hypothetical protein
MTARMFLSQITPSQAGLDARNDTGFGRGCAGLQERHSLLLQ